MRWECGVFSVMVIFLFLLGGVTVGFAAEKSGRALFEKKCGACHSIDKPKSQGKTRAEWQTTAVRMKGHGAALTDADMSAIVDHLAKTYPKK